MSNSINILLKKINYFYKFAEVNITSPITAAIFANLIIEDKKGDSPQLEDPFLIEFHDKIKNFIKNKKDEAKDSSIISGMEDRAISTFSLMKRMNEDLTSLFKSLIRTLKDDKDFRETPSISEPARKIRIAKKL